MTINEIKELVYRVSNTSMSGNVSPEDFNLFLMRTENALYEQIYSQYEKTRAISDYLSPFKTSQVYMPVPTGSYSYPSDYRHATSFVKYDSSGNETTIEEVPQDKRANRVNSEVIPIADYPIVVHQYANGFQVIPKLTWVKMYYLKIPTYAKWGYTIVSGRPVYDAGASIQSSFPEALHPDIAIGILKYMGLELTRQELASWQ